ncbi:MAG: acyl-ACP desaturase, partial [Bacteroidota bacterium]|nr:acyl-ACP desaturase [Bacteroidota bacterium]
MIATLASKVEVLKYLESFVSESITKFLKTVEDSWQPAYFLPDASMESFFDEVKNLQERAKELSYDLLAVLIGDTITEEALPTYESWLFAISDINTADDSPWTKWNRAW